MLCVGADVDAEAGDGDGALSGSEKQGICYVFIPVVSACVLVREKETETEQKF